MKQSVKKEWLAKLRSGNYLQGASLKDTNGHYCCLGVLCQLHHETVGAPSNTEWTLYPGDTCYHYLREVGILPREVMEWAELQDQHGNFKDDHGNWDSLTRLNDRGVPFPEIADVIEEFF